MLRYARAISHCTINSRDRHDQYKPDDRPEVGRIFSLRIRVFGPDWRSCHRDRGSEKKLPGWSVSDSLIVLPEAFDMGHVYEPPAPELPAGELLEQLRTRLAAPLRISFVVASLIELIQRTGSLQAAANSFAKNG